MLSFEREPEPLKSCPILLNVLQKFPQRVEADFHFRSCSTTGLVCLGLVSGDEEGRAIVRLDDAWPALSFIRLVDRAAVLLRTRSA